MRGHAEDPGLTLDTGALLALERGHRRLRALLRRAKEQGTAVAVPAGVVAQSWRGGPRQARVAGLLRDVHVTVPPLDDLTARAVGLVCGRIGHADIVDAHVALHARQHGHRVVTSDPDDIRAIDPRAVVIEV